MTKYRVKTRVYCMKRQYEPGDECDESVARALGEDAEIIQDSGVSEGDGQSLRKTKPIKKASLK